MNGRRTQVLTTRVCPEKSTLRYSKYDLKYIVRHPPLQVHTSCQQIGCPRKMASGCEEVEESHSNQAFIPTTRPKREDSVASTENRGGYALFLTHVADKVETSPENRLRRQHHHA